MKVRFQVEGEAWREGEILSIHGGRDLDIVCRDDVGNITYSIILAVSYSEILFHLDRFVVTGFQKDEEGTYHLVSINFHPT
ncbi:MAG: hypothetical protein KGL39_00460 [Patescibacteria group bacterium]|nr:hypothetical protein [Patescibacteria group bacterium]